jgi:hypothetical protein
MPWGPGIDLRRVQVLMNTLCISVELNNYFLLFQVQISSQNVKKLWKNLACLENVFLAWLTTFHVTCHRTGRRLILQSVVPPTQLSSFLSAASRPESVTMTTTGILAVRLFSGSGMLTL